MVDYNKSTGSSGTMRIRDTGTTVEFWLNSGNSTTFNHALPWSYTDASGTSGTKYFDYSAGDGWVRVRSWTVTTDQSVTFRIGDTGTSGFGGPTSLTVSIDRATWPAAPSVVTISAITATSIHGDFTDGANNGAAIDTRQIGYGTNSASPQNTITSDRSTTIAGLTPGTLYYFWARTHNVKGWSTYGPRSSATTIKVPSPPDPPIISNATQVSFVASFTENSNGGSPILERQLTYNLVDTVNSGSPVSFNYTGVMTVTGLSPGTRYYVWARLRNAAGWGAYSLPSSVVVTVAGAQVLVGSTWKQAIPYVRDGGVWKLAQPWGRTAGVWKETT